MNLPTQPPTDDAIGHALAAVGDTPLPGELDDAAIVAGALAGLAAGIPSVGPVTAASAPGGRVGLWVVGTVIAGLAAAAALILLFVRPALMSPDDNAAHSLAGAVVDQAAEAEAVRAREQAAHARKQSVRPEPKPEPEPEPEPEVEPEPVVAPAAVKAPVRRGEGKTADELLRQAQTRLAAGDKVAALLAYGRLVKRFPRSNEARAAEVSIARIELGRGRAAKALKRFDSYLAAQGGSLREEARYGRIRALRKLGRSRQEKASVASFLADHPKSVYAPRLERRLSELDASE